ncbi:Ig-like domain-containing protein [Maritimibacter sp. DP1N21-5]|uniref:Ig-like domain-containing protein n=1 Tax=Maritimibacter sp. DP1N21-5 TaxID=2836867 RepID=UPI001C44686D|nr:Ig-like domain-containing protein [Maritimibacter sp. DP1N21-5]MBV7407856.1 BapA prefix-like domain-containing protein [Maritimibacter sp. DP1N21-5]
MSAIPFVIRDAVGNLQQGSVTNSIDIQSITMPQASHVSLDLRRLDVAGYLRSGQDLVLLLTDGRKIVLEEYYGLNGDPQSTLYLNEGGHLIETRVSATGAVTHVEADTWGKFSDLDALSYPDDPVVTRGDGTDDTMVAGAYAQGYAGGEEEVTMGPGFAAIPLMGFAGAGGGGALAAAGLGAAGLGAVALASGGGGAGAGGTGAGGGAQSVPASVTLTPGSGANGSIVVNGAGHASGQSTLTGTTQPGSTVIVTVGGTDYPATVGPNGNWSATIPSTALPGGEYSQTVIVTATNGSGNSTSTSGTLVIDTVTQATVNGTGGADGIVNGAEAAAGVTFTGTGEPGARVEASFQGVTHTGTVGANGQWSVDFDASEIPSGEYSGTLTVVATDLYGNTTTVTDVVTVDTLTTLTAQLSGAGTDGIVNAAEAQVGVTLSGLAEPGATVTVTIGTVTLPANVAGNGAYSVTFAGANLPAGETRAIVSVTATDLAGNTTTAQTTVAIDTLVRDFSFTSTPIGGDGVLSTSELAAGVTITGTVEPGSTVTVSFGNVLRNASVAANGSWSATFAPGTIPSGEYDALFSVSARDAAGNVATMTESVRVDTDAGQVAISPAMIEIDDIVNAAERADGVTVTGTATPGMAVVVTLGNASTTVLSSATGQWSATFAPGQIPVGTYDAAITARITDSYGNTKTASDGVRIDTVVDNLTGQGVVDVDGVINGAEAAAGATLTGTVEPGSTVQVTMNGFTHAASVDAAGSWAANFLPGELPLGELNVPVTVRVVDPAGNPAMITDTVRVDTLVNTLSRAAALDGNPAINAAEAATGVTFTGTVERGSSVVVNLGEVAHAAVVDGNGNWAVTFSPAEIGTGERNLQLSVTATDAAGNARLMTETIVLDTVAPDGPYVNAYTREGENLRAILVETGDSEASIVALSPTGAQSAVTHTAYDDLFRQGEVYINFPQDLPNGSHLVITKTDDAGNESSTLFVQDRALPDTINMANPGFANHQIEAIDLRFAEDSQLTISADVLEGLSVNTNALTIHGSADDRVIIDITDGSAFTNTNQHVTIGNQDYTIYTLGDEGGMLIIDDDIQLTT